MQNTKQEKHKRLMHKGQGRNDRQVKNAATTAFMVDAASQARDADSF